MDFGSEFDFEEGHDSRKDQSCVTGAFGVRANRTACDEASVRAFSIRYSKELQ
jgi:hypothetical protein